MSTNYTDAEIAEATRRQREQIEEDLLLIHLRQRMARVFSPGGTASQFKPGSPPAPPNNNTSEALQPREVDINPVQPAARPALSTSEHNAFPKGRFS